MKKKYVILSLTLIVIFSTFVCFNYKKVVNVYEDNSKNEEIVTKGLSMNLEQTAGAGDYKQVTQSNWPTEGYVFNSELSKCENGSTLSWDDTKKTVVFSGNVSDKCYVYFDIYVPTIADYCTSGTDLATCVKKFGNQGPDISSIYIHNASLTNGAGDNSYRYAGASDSVNNFVCFGTNTNPCPTDNLYRIIGVINDKVKLIKYDYATSDLLGTDGDSGGYSYTPDLKYYKGSLTTINYYYWNYKATNNAVNTWSTSLLNTINLNTNYFNNIGGAWANKIAITIWKVGGNTEENLWFVTPSVAYQNEIVDSDATNSTDNATEYEAKIGLMYVSDYGFAASPESWTLTMDSYSKAINNNWMYMGEKEWTITRISEDSMFVFYVYDSGEISGYDQTNSFGALRPVFNLESSVTYVSGDGTQSSPIRIN